MTRGLVENATESWLALEHASVKPPNAQRQAKASLPHPGLSHIFRSGWLGHHLPPAEDLASECIHCAVDGVPFDAYE
jgi:hypothetical protein